MGFRHYKYIRDLKSGAVRRLRDRTVDLTAAIVLAITGFGGGFIPLLINSTAHATADHVVINEVSSHSSNDWVELYNPTPTTVDLTGWSVEDDAGHTSTDFSSNSISSLGFVTVDMSNLLNKDGDTATLYDNNTQIDQVSYGGTSGLAAPTNDSKTLSRVPDGSDNWLIQQETKDSTNDSSVAKPVITNVMPASGSQIGGTYTVSADISHDPNYSISSATYSVTALVAEDVYGIPISINQTVITNSPLSNISGDIYQASLDTSTLPTEITESILGHSLQLPVTSFDFSFDAIQNSPSNSTADEITSNDITINPSAISTAMVTGQDFDTWDNSANGFKGINVGFETAGYTHIDSITVTLQKGGSDIVSNTASTALLDDINNQKGGFTQNGQLSSPFVVSGTLNDTYCQGGPCWDAGSHTWTTSEQPDTALVTVTGTDPSGNVTKSVNLSPLTEPDGVTFADLFPADTTPPTTPTFTGFTDPTLACGDITNVKAEGLHINWTASSAVSGINQYTIIPTYPDSHGEYTYYPPGSATSAWIGDNFGRHGDGVYTYTIKAKSNSGLWSNSATCNLTYDSTPPTVSVTPVAGSTLHGTENFKITINDANPATSANKYVWVYLYNTKTGQQSGQKVDLSSGTGTFTVNTKDLADGTYNLDVGIVKDAAGNASGTKDNYFDGYTIDNSAPTVSVIAPSSGEVLGGLGNNYQTTVKLKIDDPSGVNLDSKYTWVEFYDGTAVSGSVSPQSQKFALTPIAGTTDEYEAVVDTSSFVPPLYNSGTYSLQVRAQDDLGNGSSHDYYYGGHHGVKLLIDNARGKATINTPADGSFVSNTHGIPVTVTASDNEGPIDRVDIVVDQVDSTGKFISQPVKATPATYDSKTGTWWFTIPAGTLGDGTYTIKAVAYDQVGNVAYAGNKITVDNEAPTVTFSSPSGNYLNSTKPFTISGDYTEHGDSGISRIQLYISKGSEYNYNDHVGYLTANLSNKPTPADGATGAFNYTLTQSQVDELSSKLGISDGDQFTITAVAIDNAGNGQRSSNDWKDSSITLTADNTAPDIQINNAEVTGDPYYKLGEPINVHVIDSNLADTQITATSRSKDNFWDYKTGHYFGLWWLRDGDYSMISTDAAGNSTTITFRVDHTRPVISSTSYTGGTLSGSTLYNPTSFTINANDNASNNKYGDVQSGLAKVVGNVYMYDPSNNGYTLQRSNFTTNDSLTVDLSGLSDGKYYVKYNAEDVATNISETSEFYFTVDNTAPVVDITSPSDGALLSYAKDGTVAIKGSVTDTNPDHYYWRITGPGGYDKSQTVYDSTSLTNQTITNWDLNGLASGTYTIDLEARDAAGNKSADSVQTIQVTVDNTAPNVPTASFTANNDGTQSVTLSASDNTGGSGLGSIYYTLDGTDPTSKSTLYTGAFTLNPAIAPNVTTIKAIAYDNAGNASSIFTVAGPAISSEASQNATTSSITLVWTTSEPATSRVVYDTVPHTTLGSGANYGYAFSTVEDTNLTTNHSVTISGLTAGTTYYFRIVSHGSPTEVSQQITGFTEVASIGGNTTYKVFFAPANTSGGGGNVLGSQTTTPSTNGDKTGVKGDSTNQPSQNLTTTNASSGFNYNWLWLLLLLLIIPIYYFARKQSGKDNA